MNIMSEKFKENCVFIWLLLLTLNSYYFYNLGLPLFSFLGAIFTLPLFKIFNFKLKNYQRPILIVITSLFLISTISIMLNSSYVLGQRFIVFLLFYPVALFSTYLFKEEKILFEKVIKKVIIVHLSFFFIQFISFYGFGYFIDFLEPITGESQRAFGGNYSISSSGNMLIRVTGLFNEPGTYATYMMLLLGLFKVSLFQSGQKYKLTKFDFIVLFSVLLSFSVFGFVFVFIFCLPILFKASFKNKLFLAVCSSPIIYIVYTRYLSVRFSNELQSDNGGEFRSEAIGLLYNNITDSLYHLLFGYSHFVDMNKLFNTSLAWNDVGLIFTMFLEFGLVGVSIIFFFISPQIKAKFVVVLITLLCKISLTTFFLWVCISFLFIDNEIFGNLKNNIVKKV